MDIIKSKSYNHITLAEAKKQLRVSPNFLDDDSQISGLLKVATDMAANYIENHVALTVVEHFRKEFTGSILDIDQGHFHSLQSIEYTDRKTGQVVTLMNGTGCRVNADKVIFLVILDNDVDALNLKVNFTCGYDANNIEPVIKQAILIKLTDLYDVERASYHSGGFQLNNAFTALLSYHKRIKIY